MFMKKARVFVAAAGMLALAVGCSSTVDTTPKPGPLPEGKLVQGYVMGAEVWADEVNSTTGVSNFTIDQKEEATKTISDDDGNFKLGAAPTYDYVLASVGGTDKLSGKPAIPMLAPKGAKNITPLTTLVAMTPVGADRQALVNALGGNDNFDVDIANSGGVNPEVLKIAKVVENVVRGATGTTANMTVAKSVMAQQVKLVGVVATEIRTEIKNKGVTNLAGLGAITEATSLANVAERAVVEAVSSNVIKVADLAGTVAEVKGDVEKIVKTIVDNIVDGKVKEETVVKETSKASVKASSIALTFENGRRPYDVVAGTVALPLGDANSLKEAEVTLAFDSGAEITRNNSELTITTTRTGSKQKLNVTISNVVIKVENKGNIPKVTLGMDNARLAITGVRSNGVEVKATFNSAKDVKEVLDVDGNKIRLKLNIIEDKISKKDDFKDVQSFTFSPGSYDIKFALNVANVFDDVNVKLTVTN